MSFVLANANNYHLISETVVMESFISESEIMGELGYCLATIQSAVEHVMKL